MNETCFFTNAGICSDAFMKSKEKPAKLCWIQSVDHKFLVLNAPENFKFEDRTVHDQEKSGKRQHSSLFASHSESNDEL